MVKLGLGLETWSSATAELPMDRIRRAEAVGFDSVWSAEAYGSDAVTPLAYLAGLTKRIKLGTGIMQLAARTPAKRPIPGLRVTSRGISISSWSTAKVTSSHALVQRKHPIALR